MQKICRVIEITFEVKSPYPKKAMNADIQFLENLGYRMKKIRRKYE